MRHPEQRHGVNRNFADAFEEPSGKAIRHQSQDAAVAASIPSFTNDDFLLASYKHKILKKQKEIVIINQTAARENSVLKYSREEYL